MPIKQINPIVIVAILAGIFLLGPQLGLFGITLGKELPFKSDVIFKVGTEGPLKFQETTIYAANNIIGNVYGLAILNTPVELEDDYNKLFINTMKEANDDCPAAYYPVNLTCPIFSDTLIDKIEENSHSFSDIITIKNELEDSLNNICDGIKDFKDIWTDEFFLLAITFCNNKPDEILKKEGGKYVWNVNDVTVTVEEHDYSHCLEFFSTYGTTRTCEGWLINEGLPADSIPPFNWQKTTTDLVCVLDFEQTRTGGCSITYEPGKCEVGCTPNWECSAWSTCSGGTQTRTCTDLNKCENDKIDTRKCNGATCEPKITNVTKTLRLSNINLELSQKKGDIFIAFGDKGIKEADAIDGKYEFAQYAYEIEHKDSDIDFMEKNIAGYGVATNNQGIIDATNGTITKTNFLSDFWYGLTKGEAFMYPIFLIIIIIGIFVLIIILKK